MLNVMERSTIVYLVLLALALGFLAWTSFTGLVLILHFEESWGWASVALGSISLAGAFLGALGHPWTVNWVWRKFPTLNRWVAPNLNGIYQLETSSNWPIQKRMLDCAQGRGAGQPADNGNDILVVTGTLTITQGLFGINATYVPDAQAASKSESHVVAASLEAPGQDGRFRFHYVYQGEVPNPTDATDGERYYGAASLRIPENPLDPLTGHYWTNRSWRKGINTAGEAQLRRADSLK